MGNGDQNKLLRPPPAAQLSDDAVGKRRSNLIVPVLLTALAISGIIITFLIGRLSMDNPTPVIVSEKPAEKNLSTTIAPVVAKPEPQPERPIELPVAALKSSDSEKLDMGCACGFSVGKNDYLAISSETAIFKANGETKVCPISSDQFDDFYGDEGRFQCGSYRVSISGRGEVGPGFDGHSRKATLRIEKAPLLKVMSGKWLCGC